MSAAYGATGLPGAHRDLGTPRGVRRAGARRGRRGQPPGRRRARSGGRAWPAPTGTSSRPASSTAGASIATTDSAGALQSREVSEPLPSSATPSSTPASARNCSSVRSSGSAVPRPRPSTATSPRVVVAGGEQPRQRGERVRRRPAVHPVVQRVPQRAHLHDDVDATAQRRGQGGHADPPVRGVGEHQHVGGQPLPVLGEQGGQRRGADLLLARRPGRRPTTPGSSPRARTAAQCTAIPALSSAAPRP